MRVRGNSSPLLERDSKETIDVRRRRCPHLAEQFAHGGDPVRVIPHRGVDDDSGSLEVWFADGRKSVRFYWDNVVSRRLSGNTLTREQAIEKATALARAEMDKLDNPE